MKFHHNRICFQVIQTPSNTRADLLNLEIQPYLLPSDNLNATFLPHKEKAEKRLCVCVCACMLVWYLQLDLTTKELWWQVPTQTLYVSITVILLACPNCTKPSSFRAPNQGQPGLATSNPIRSSTMITKPSDTGCQQTLSRQPYLADPWLQSHWRGLVYFKLSPPPFASPFISPLWFLATHLVHHSPLWKCVLENHAAHNSDNLWIFFPPLSLFYI